jgi:UDP-GlcNAc:undecaprenyl-phosphate/decaprenyl-phosphate GlcNAc-1-phosphate transferase
MIFFFPFILILIFALFYTKIANDFKIIDKPLERSSHDYNAKTGGGLIFVFSIIIWYMLSNQDTNYFFWGLLMLSTISYIDDLYQLPKIPRLIFQILGAILLIFSITAGDLSIFFVISLILVTVGWLNVYNFMDGINGMAGIYALVSLISFFFFNERLEFTDQSLIVYSIMGLLIFGFFNFRKIAILFLGDVGSIAVAFILSFLMFNLIIHTKQLAFIVMFSLFGIDSLLTIIERLLKKENITEAHRCHLYQLLSNDLKYSHLYVSIAYGSIQLIINFLVLLIYDKMLFFQFFSFGILLLLVIGYLLIKKYVKKSMRYDGV